MFEAVGIQILAGDDVRQHGHPQARDRCVAQDVAVVLTEERVRAHACALPFFGQPPRAPAFKVAVIETAQFAQVVRVAGPDPGVEERGHAEPTAPV
jgi:hypothetical protein